MMLDNYKNINEKDEFFNNESFKEPEEFWDILNELDKENKEADKKLYVFRGLSNAKYKLYNSAQRFLIEQDLLNYKKGISITNDSTIIMNWMVEFTNEIKQGCQGWKGGVIPEYFKQINPLNELEYFTYLSYLRHYNVPTPVIDVSYNPYVALYFALFDSHESESNEEIENYFSFYIFDLHLMNKYEKEHQQLHTFDSLMRQEFQTLRNVQTTSMLNNLNIINQEGCLISNIGKDPLERDYENKKNMFINNPLISKRLKDELIKKRIVSCYNIHKGAITFFRQKLNKLGVIEDFLFPNPYYINDDIMDTSFNKFLIARRS